MTTAGPTTRGLTTHGLTTRGAWGGTPARATHEHTTTDRGTGAA